MDAQKFLDAQDKVWPQVVRELKRGEKTSHWIWYVFPQLASLGRSERARHFGLADLAEAEAYLAHPVLRERLEEVAELLMLHRGSSPEDILGPVDALKVRSSMTLFSQVDGAPEVFGTVLDIFYDGVRCPESETK
ncbi:MAG: calpastatin [Rhodobacteraceae bacterium]|nr:calpastatin [Paracoccaceae bacterium]